MTTSDRALLEEIIRNESVLTPYSDIMAFADAIIRAGWRPQRGRTVDTVMELDSLPVGSVVRVGTTVYHKTTRSFFCWTAQADSRVPSETLFFDDGVIPILLHEGVKND